MNWLQKLAGLDKQSGIFDKIKHPLMIGMMGTGLGLLNPEDAEARRKTKTPTTHVAPVPTNAVNIPDWRDRVIHQESRGNPKATSNKGAGGLMQIMPATWTEVTKKLYGKSLPFSQAYNPEINKKVGEYYLKWIQSQLKKMMGREPTIEQILAAYNRGIGRLKQCRYDWTKMPPESRNYVKKITGIK